MVFFSTCAAVDFHHSLFSALPWPSASFVSGELRTRTGAAGVMAAGQFQPAVVLCDLGLPGGMSGYDVARALRSDPAHAGLRLVAVSGYGQPEDRERARSAGFDLHLTKPVDPAELRLLLAAG